MSIFGRVKQWNTFTRVWHLFDARWQDPFQSAVVIQKFLKGLHKPIYHPLADCGDHVVVINSKEIAMRGDEWRKRAYYHHTGYAGGGSYTLAWELHDKDPTMVLRKAVYKSLKGNLQRRYTMERLHIYPDENVPDDIKENIGNVIKRLRPVPIRLDTYSEDYIKQFPKIWNLPKDYIIR
ncbi:mitochondrial ribosomal protein L13 [Lycorma delicatula]|uniref:mitochondrial ribosomal protein L13 n=1 Tax=Lycorma delicatula TaxID=130591 RepID=UPI003F517079